MDKRRGETRIGSAEIPGNQAAVAMASASGKPDQLVIRLSLEFQGIFL